MTTTPAVQVRDLTKRYGDLTAVDAVSFDITEGEIFGLLGPNGAGKTTTISMLATLLEPSSGTATIGGFDVQRESRRVAQVIGLVPQELALYETLSAADNLQFFGQVYGLRGNTLRERVRDVLEVVGLTDRATERIEHYSGGMKRRINLAIGLLHRPRVLFLDEPTVGVDPQSRNHIFESVQRLNRDEGMAIVYTTHYMEEAQSLCHRVGIIDHGKLIALDTPRALINSEGTGIIHLSSDDAARVPADQVRALPHVERAELRDGLFEVYTKDAQQALVPILELVNSRGIRIDRLEILEPNLESVFLSLTGKRLRD